MSTQINTSKSVTVKIDNTTLQQLKEDFNEEAQTLVHCNYVSKRKFINGGWVNIHSTTYLEHNDETISLLHAENIPMAPGMHMFKRPGELKKFTLVFPRIPKEWKRFNLIEECPSGSGFLVTNIERNNTGIYEVSLH
jgi:hypothetical protein